MSRSSSGIAQVSNLGDIQITCSVPARPYSWGETRPPLKIATVAGSCWSYNHFAPNLFGKWRMNPSDVQEHAT